MASGALFKTDLLQLDAQQAVLLLNMHHIISDGWSMGVFMRDWRHAYTAFSQNEQPSLSPLKIQYSDYAIWQRQWLQGEILQQQVDYWKNQLAGLPELLELPTDKPRPPQQSYHGAHYSHSLSAELSQAITQLSREQNVTLFMTLLSGFTILLSRYSRQDDVCVGSPIANRTHSHSEDLIGFFVNTLVLRNQLQPQQSFAQLLQSTRQTCLEAYTHQDIPFEMLVEQLQPSRSLSHSPLFQVMFVLQNNQAVELSLPELELSVLQTDYPIAKFDLTLNIEERNGQLHYVWEYATDLFNAETIERMAQHFEVLLTNIIANPQQVISQFSMLTAQEIQQLQTWNQTETDYPKDKTIVDLFEQQVEKTPHAIAVVFEEQSLTYRQLNEQANQLAHYLLSLKTETGAVLLSNNPLVAIAVERSLEMIIGLLAILKAGAAYVPIDPDYPAARIGYMLADSASPLLLTQSHLVQQLALAELEYNCVVLCLDDVDVTKQAIENPQINTQAQDLAYVIYTSGSTGKSKGVMVEHLALTMHCHAVLQQYTLNENDKVLQFASFSFDTSLEQLLVAWLSGACSVLLKTNLIGPQDLLLLMKNQGITLADLPPAYWQQMLEIDMIASSLPSLRMLILGGEALPLNIAQRTRKYFPLLICFSAYGPTEAVITPTLYCLPKTLSDRTRTILIGRPRKNTGIHILNTEQQLQPIGIAGELCIAGAGLARGYLNQPELTTEKFLEVELFGKLERIYRTGDLARWLPDGNLEYLGRIDHQIKLRGFRIELGEIEAALSQHPAIKEAVVTLYEADGNKRLIAYVVENREQKIEDKELRDWLKARLPDYMLPSSFVMLENLPLTPNGKIDRKALPAPDNKTASGNNLPRNAVELQLLSVWETVLNVHPLGINDNFFELGGHSLLAVQLMSHIQQHFAVRLPVSALFQHPTVASLAEQLQQNIQPTSSNIVPIQIAENSNPIYCLPGVMGSVMYLYPLASCLGQQQTFYGLQTPGLDGSTTPETIEALASYHLHALQQQQATWPYQLVGHSSGGRVAFEMARQLEQQGETIALLAILDTPAPNANEPDPTTDYTELNCLSDIVLAFEELATVELNLSLQDLQALPNLETAYMKVMQVFQQQQILFAPNASLDELKALVNTYRVTAQAHTDYQISGKLHCPIHLFRASEQNPNIAFEDNRKTWGWAEYTHATVTEHWVSGTHGSMMRNPHVKALADELSHCLLSSLL